jgi:hypothetical protein
MHISASASAAPSLLIIAHLVAGEVVPSFASLAIQIGALGAIRFCRLLQVVRGRADGESGRIQRRHAAPANSLNFVGALAARKSRVIDR